MSGIPEYHDKPEGYQKGAKVTYKGYIFEAAFWSGTAPGIGDADHNGWRLAGELPGSTTPTAKANVIAYLPSWKKGAQAELNIYKNATHVIVCFVTFSEKDIAALDPSSVKEVESILPAVVQVCRNSNTHCMVAIGGANDYAFNHLMRDVTSPNAPTLKKAVQSIVDFVIKHNLDGIDLDMECWWPPIGSNIPDEGGNKAGNPRPAGKGLTILAGELRRALGNGKIISAALPATSWYGNNFDGQALSHIVDWMGIMTYDLTGSWNASPVGPHSALWKIPLDQQDKFASEQQIAWDKNNQPITSVQESIWYWSNPFFMDWLGKGQNIPKNKLVIGVPLYGYDFAHDKGPQLTGYATYTYKEIVAKYGNQDSGNIKVPGSSRRPWFVNTAGNYPFANNIYYDNPKIAAEKMNYAKQIGTQGILLWEATCDDWADPILPTHIVARSAVHAESVHAAAAAAAGATSVMHALYSGSGNPAKPDFKAPDGLVGGGAQYSPAIASLRANLLAYYPLQNDGQNYLDGGERNNEFHNMKFSADGIFGPCADFTTPGTALKLRYPMDKDMSGSDYAISVQVKMKSLQRLDDDHGSWVTIAGRLKVQNFDGKILYFFMFEKNGTLDTVQISSVNAISENEWHSVVVNYNSGENKVYLYIDMLLDSTIDLGAHGLKKGEFKPKLQLSSIGGDYDTTSPATLNGYVCQVFFFKSFLDDDALNIVNGALTYPGLEAAEVGLLGAVQPKRGIQPRFAFGGLLAVPIFLGIGGLAHAADALYNTQQQSPAQPHPLEGIVNAIREKVGYPSLLHDKSRFPSRKALGIPNNKVIHIDWGGEGYTVVGTIGSGNELISGFADAINVNAQEYNSQLKQRIPLLLLTHDWSAQPYLPVGDKFANRITMQGTPLGNWQVDEIVRVLAPGGTVSLWVDYDSLKTNIEEIARRLNSKAVYPAADEEFNGRYPAHKKTLIVDNRRRDHDEF